MEESTLDTRPRLSWEEAAPLAAEFGSWQLRKDLPSERDRNFHVHGGGLADEEAVFKVHNLAEDAAFVECQNEALKRCAAAGAPSQRLINAKDGQEVKLLTVAGQENLICRMLSYLPGEMLDCAKRQGDQAARAALWAATGRSVGAVAAAMIDFDHAAAHRDFVWDLQHFERVVGAHLPKVPVERRPIIERLLADFRSQVSPLLPQLRLSVVHNDPNDFNLVILDGGEVGVLDFGDMCYSYTVADAAICVAYLLFACGADEPLAASVAPFVTAFHGQCPLREEEAQAVFGLAVARLCTSVCMSAHQCSLEPDNEYLAISAGPAWKLLERLDAELGACTEDRQEVMLTACGFATEAVA